MDLDLQKRIADVARDRQSGASELVAHVIGILRETISRGADLEPVVAALREAQPSMAPVWNSTSAAMTGDLERFAHRVARAPDAIARFLVDTLETGLSPGADLRVVTVSYSSTVAHALEAVARRRSIRVDCSEGRPALEGRRLAARLAAAGIPVTFYVDAALALALGSADALVVGADAITPESFINKVGTRMVAADASRRGIPVYVLASRDKFAPGAFQDRLRLRTGSPAEVWADVPTGVTVENPYFERIPLELIAGLVSDMGVLSSADAADVCASSRHI